MNPMIAKPIAVASAIFWNSADKRKKIVTFKEDQSNKLKEEE